MLGRWKGIDKCFTTTVWGLTNAVAEVGLLSWVVDTPPFILNCIAGVLAGVVVGYLTNGLDLQDIVTYHHLPNS